MVAHADVAADDVVLTRPVTAALPWLFTILPCVGIGAGSESGVTTNTVLRITLPNA